MTVSPAADGVRGEVVATGASPMRLVARVSGGGVCVGGGGALAFFEKDHKL